MVAIVCASRSRILRGDRFTISSIGHDVYGYIIQYLFLSHPLSSVARHNKMLSLFSHVIRLNPLAIKN